MARRELPEINASSMADIAFLLLTFFLIATTLNREEGIQRLVPNPDDPNIEDQIDVHERNLLRILVNQQGAIQINGENAPITDIKERVIEFVDNGGGKSVRKAGETCDYCKGTRNPELSDTPYDAVISIELDNATPYNYFYTVENMIDQAFYELYTQYSRDIYKMSYEEVMASSNAEDADEAATSKLDAVHNAYPKNIAKARLRDNLY